MSFFVTFKILVSLFYGAILGGVCDIIRQVFLSLFPEYVEIVFSYSVSDPIKYHVYCSGFFCFDVPLTILFYDIFSISTGVGGCGWTISDMEVCTYVAFYQFSNNPPNSASVADAIIFLITMNYKFTSPFYGSIGCIGVLDFGPRKNIHLLCFVPLVLRYKIHPNICG